MDLSDLLRAIWKHKVTAILILMVTMGAVYLVTVMMPKMYTATTMLGSSWPSSLITGYTPKTSDNNDQFNIYEQLVGDANFKNEVFGRAKQKDQDDNMRNVSFTSFSIDANPVSNANILQLAVEAPSGAAAKALADAAAETLLEKSLSLGSNDTKKLRSSIRSELKSTDSELVGLRKELAFLRNEPASKNDTSRLERVAEVGHFQDQIAVAENQRKTYNEILTRMSLNDILNQGVLQLVYPATIPLKPTSPSLPQNLFISFVVGLSLGVLTTVALDYGQKTKSKENIGRI